MTKLHRSEAGTQGARRIARAQMSAAVHALGHRPLSDKDVHSARKSLKKARAMVRLLRASIGDRTYRRENALLRDIARPLSEVRDAKVLLQTLDRLSRRSRALGAPLPLGELRRMLRRERTAIQRKRLRGSRPFADQLEALREARRRASRWRVGRKGWSILGTGLARVYGQARRALCRAEAEQTAETLHEWRKQTKYLWHQLQVLEPMGAPVRCLAHTAHDIADTLGEDHDLWVLRARIAVHVSTRADRRRLLSLIDRRSSQLRAQALALAGQLYADPAPAFEAHLRPLWRAWRHGLHARAARGQVRSWSASKAGSSPRSWSDGRGR
jgi:hypothetical protein